MSFSFGPSASYVQSPRFAIVLNGITVPRPIDAQVVTNNYSEAAKFTAEFAMDQPLAVYMLDQTHIAAEIVVSLNNASPVSMVYGFVDNIEVDPLSLHCSISGRDMAALLLDTPIQQPYQNMSSSAIIEMFVNEHAALGLKGNITDTGDLAGRFYGTDYDQTKYGDLYRPTNEWSMALMLAQGEGFDLRIGGPDADGNILDSKTLYFGPPPPSESTVYQFVVNYGPPIASNAEGIKITRSLTLAKDVQVNVIGWNSLQMRPIVQKLKASSIKAPSGGFGPVQNYTFRMPGDATPAQALAYAEMKMAEITAFERVVTINCPGELTITPAHAVQLLGTGTSADQTYFIDEITRRWNFKSGFTESMRLKNHSPYNVTPVV